VETAKYELLSEVLRDAHGGRVPRARETLSTLVDGHLDRSSAADLQYFLFAAAISKRLEGHRGEEINLYLRRYERSQISLFGLLARHLPTVALAGRVGNELLVRFLAGRRTATLLDIGIGSGQQEVALLYELARRGLLPEQLTIVAVEPSAESLRVAQRALAEVADRLELELTIVPIHSVVETLGEADWALIAAQPTPLAVLGAFAVHHVRDADVSSVADDDVCCARDAFFARLRTLNPAGVVLCEPSSDHHRAGFFDRFENAWRHFGKTFQLIDRLEVTADEAASMKMFFAREIEDILAGADDARCERHEPVATWVDRLRRTGYSLYPHLAFARAFPHDHIDVVAHDGYVGLDFGGETLVAVIGATSGAEPMSADRGVPLPTGAVAA
jgi:hypothetical protein